MSDLKDQFAGTTQKTETERLNTSRTDTATRMELDKRLEGRQNYPPDPEHNHPAPDWVVNPTNQVREQMRRNENRINNLRNRLLGASCAMRRDFDQSR